jgi:hypothetical protein
MKVLQSALARHPYDREILFALATYERASGDVARAHGRAQLLRELEPENRDYARLAQQLETGQGPPR